MFEIDSISHLVTVDAEMPWQQFEKKLNHQGYTLGFYSPSSIPKKKNQEEKVKDVLGQNLKNLYSGFYGELSELCVSLILEGKKGIEFHPFLAPRKATGPNWKNLILGTKSRLGKMTQATFKIFKIPAQTLYITVFFDTLQASNSFERFLTRRELIPRAFGRFAKQDLKNYPADLPSNWMLALEWAGSRRELGACEQELDDVLQGNSFQKIDSPRAQNYLFKLLRKNLPDPAWGGLQLLLSDDATRIVEEEILNCLC